MNNWEEKKEEGGWYETRRKGWLKVFERKEGRKEETEQWARDSPVLERERRREQEEEEEEKKEKNNRCVWPAATLEIAWTCIGCFSSWKTRRHGLAARPVVETLRREKGIPPPAGPASVATLGDPGATSSIRLSALLLVVSAGRWVFFPFLFFSFFH